MICLAIMLGPSFLLSDLNIGPYVTLLADLSLRCLLILIAYSHENVIVAAKYINNNIYLLMNYFKTIQF